MFTINFIMYHKIGAISQIEPPSYYNFLYYYVAVCWYITDAPITLLADLSIVLDDLFMQVTV